MEYITKTEIPEKANEENHYSTYLNSRSTGNATREERFVVSGNEDLDKVWFKVQDKKVWIRKSELNKLQNVLMKDGNLGLLDSVSYIAGAIGAYEGILSSSTIDGYEVIVKLK